MSTKSKSKSKSIKSAPTLANVTGASKSILAKLASIDHSTIVAESRPVGRGEGVTGVRRSAVIIETLAEIGIKQKSDATLASACAILAILAHAGMHVWIVDADGKDGKGARLATMPRIDGVTFAGLSVPAFGRCRKGFEVVDHQGRIWRAGLDGKPVAVHQMASASPALAGALASAGDDAGKASVWLAFHIAGHNMAGGVIAGLAKAGKPADIIPESADVVEGGTVTIVV